MTMPTHLFVTGKPGVGKTTLIRECAEPFSSEVGGFVTEEIREGNDRMGFRLRTFDGQSGILAKKGMKSQAKINKYGVDLDVLNSIGVASVQRALEENKVIVVDEIGSMEMLSPLFSQCMAEVMMKSKACLASIRLNSEPFTSQIKKLMDSKLILLDRSNYSKVKQEMKNWFQQKVRI